MTRDWPDAKDGRRNEDHSEGDGEGKADRKDEKEGERQATEERKRKEEQDDKRRKPRHPDSGETKDIADRGQERKKARGENL